MKARKKPVIIETEQYNGNNNPFGAVKINEDGKGYIETMHEGQTVILEPGDWIIPDGKPGTFYPCKPDVFERTYDIIEEEKAPVQEPVPMHVMEKIADAMRKSFDERQQKPFQYVVGYYRVKDDSLIGYHLSSFCQTTQVKTAAKRYNGQDPYKQLAIIRGNLDSTLAAKDIDKDKPFGSLNLSIKEQYFHGLEKNDIWINAEYLDESIPPQRFEYHVVNKDKKETDES